MTTRKYEWINVNHQADFAPRDGAGALVFNDRMWLLGGWNPEDETHFPRICSNDIWSSADGKTWDLEKPNTFLDQSFTSSEDWEGRHTAGYVVHGGRMWIVGGDVNQGHYQNDVWSSEDGRSWNRCTDSVPWGPRALHHTLAFRAHIWVMGGQTIPQFAASETCFHDDIWRSADGNSWDLVESTVAVSPGRGMIGGSAVFQDRMWILGGGTYDTPDVPTRKFFNDVWSSADGKQWECHLENAPWTARQYHDVAVFDDCLWVLEGYNTQGNRNDVWFSPNGVDWEEVPDTPWSVRHAASVFVFRNALWMIAGNNMTSDVWKLQRV